MSIDPPIQSLQVGMGWLPDRPGSGVDRVYYALAQHLPEVNVGVRGIVMGSDGIDGPLSTSPTVLAAATADDSLPHRLWGIRQVAHRLIKESAPDVLATHFGLYALPLLTLSNIPPHVVHFHGPWALESQAEGANGFVTFAKARIEKLVYQRGLRFIVLSKAFKSVLVQTYDVPADRVRIVPGGVDTSRFNLNHSVSQARARLGWPQNRPLIFSVRRLVRRVGLEPLIEAMNYVRDHVPDALLLIAGKGPLAQRLQERIAAHGLERHVRLLGFVPDKDLPAAYRAADFSIVPTVALEGFGLVAVESLAAGTPVLVTPVGGLPEVVSDLSPDLVMAGSSVEALQEHMVAALKGSLNLPSDEACRAFATARHDWSTIAQQVRGVYEEVLS